MKNLIYISILGFLLLSCTSEGEKSKTSDQNNKQPNILLVVVDDMGWTDTEPYGGEISTPTISNLAKSGMLFTDFHTSGDNRNGTSRPIQW